MSYTTLDLRREGPLAWLTLDRPQQLNAMNEALVAELRDFLTGLRDDPATRVVILRGAGRAFCAGLDLKDPPRAEAGLAGALRLQRRISELAILMRRAPQPAPAGNRTASNQEPRTRT